MSAPRWQDPIDRMLTRIRDTAGRVLEGFPHWADPETGRANRYEFIVGSYYLLESLLGLAGRLDPLRL